jgi:small subunit ribosomal protein S21
MVTVKVLEDKYGNSNLERALKKFKKEVMKEGIMKAYEKKRYFVKPSAKKHQKKVWQKHLNKVIQKQEKLAESKFDTSERSSDVKTLD